MYCASSSICASLSPLVGLEPLRVAIPARGRLGNDCHVMTEQIRALDRSRIGEGPLTKLTSDEMLALEHSLMGVLGML